MSALDKFNSELGKLLNSTYEKYNDLQKLYGATEAEYRASLTVKGKNTPKSMKLKAKMNDLVKKISKEKDKADKDFYNGKFKLKKELNEGLAKEDAKQQKRNLRFVDETNLERKAEALGNVKYLSSEQKSELIEIQREQKLRKTRADKQEQQVARLVARMESSNFLRFIRKPADVIGPAIRQNIEKSPILAAITGSKVGKGLSKINTALGVGKAAFGEFFKDSKFAKFLVTPMTKAFSKVFPYKNIVEFLLSPAGMTIVMTLFTILKNFVWIPLVKWYNDHIQQQQSNIDFMVDWGNEIKAELNYISDFWVGAYREFKDILKFSNEKLKADLINISDFWVEKYGYLKDDLNNISDFWVEKYGYLKTDINDNIIQPLKNLWAWLEGMGGAIKNMAAIVGSELLNKLSTMINNAFINPLKNFEIFGKYPFSSIKTIPKVPAPDLDPATVKFLSGASQLDEVKQESQDIAKKLTNTGNAVVSMERVRQQRESTRIAISEMLEEKEQERNRRETIQIAKLNEVQKSITENTEINKTIITNNKATGITINASKESMREFAPDFTGLTYSIAGGMGTF